MTKIFPFVYYYVKQILVELMESNSFDDSGLYVVGITALLTQ